MDRALLLLQAWQTWIYLLLGAGLAFSLGRARRWRRIGRSAEFGLERERARRGLVGAAVLGAWFGLLTVTTFVLTTFIAPSVPAASRPTPLPTVSLLSTPATPPADLSGPAATALPEAALDASGCLNPQATLTFPEEGSALAGTVTVSGTAAIANFAFYKYEYIELAAGAPAPGAVWRAVSAGTSQVTDDDLGLWDTTLVTPGEYAFRLVVTDTAGNAPLPCVRRIRVLPGG